MKMDPIIIDDDDDDVQAVCEMGQQPSRTKNLAQPTLVLTAMYDSEEPTPAQNRQIRVCEQLLKPHFSVVTAYRTYIRRTSANDCQLTLWSKSPSIVDLTNDLEENLDPSTSQCNVDPSTSRGDVDPFTSRGNVKHQITFTTLQNIDEASWAMDNLPGSVEPIDLTLPRRATSDKNVQQTSERNNKE